LNAALYARVSTRDREQNPETQLLPLREWAVRCGYAVTEYVDQASAADFTRRTAWTRLLEDIRRRRVDVVAVVRLDRAFRSVPELHRTLAEWTARGVEFMCLTQPVDTTTPHGRLMLTLIGAMAEFERDLIAVRVREGMRRAKADGKHIGRPHLEDYRYCAQCHRAFPDGHFERAGHLPGERVGDRLARVRANGISDIRAEMSLSRRSLARLLARSTRGVTVR
jgi:DNA invertase Pin-like site-specific DNA recombinase